MSVYQGGVSERFVERAALALLAGQVVAIPTDTVYGLSVYPKRQGASGALFALKGRPAHFGLPVLVSGTEQADELVAGGLPPGARKVAQRYWPGAVTLVLRRREGLDWELGGDPSTIGLRCPNDAFARALCERVGPLATTSANPHGEAPLPTPDEIRARFGERVAVVIEGGRLEGLSSTVVDMTGDRAVCLREGAVPFAEIETLVG